MFGTDLARKDADPGVRRQFAFVHTDQALSVCFDAATVPGLTLVADSDPAVPIVEGEVAFF
jgi:hypothetical protein